jgi:hypothetical protein
MIIFDICLAVTAFLIGTFLLWRLLREDIPEEILLVAALWAAGGTGGLFLVVQATKLVPPWFLAGSKLIFWESLIGGGFTFWLYLRKNHLQLWELLDQTVAAFLLTLTVGFGFYQFAQWIFVPNTRNLTNSMALVIVGETLIVNGLAVPISRNYRRWRFYPSGRVGFVGLTSLGLLFLLNLVLAPILTGRVYLALADDWWLSFFGLVTVSCLLYYRSGRKVAEETIWLKTKLQQLKNRSQPPTKIGE